MTTARPDSRLGTDLGPYRIERVLGRGGMGVVYLAEQRELGRKVALKLLPDELAQDADFRARFDRESHLAASIDHPNIIPLYEAGEIDGTAFLAMRFVDGVDLASRLADGPLDPSEAVGILAQVAGALDAAHARRLVHRDVKPGNVLLDRTAQGEHAYLTDFGLTKQTGTESGLTRMGSFMGTPAYMAPEQIEGQEVDGRADQYSLACLAFELLTGSVPFIRDQEFAVAMAHVRDRPPAPTSLRPELPAGVDIVFAQAMAKDREARYETCTAFIDDLRSAVGGGAVVARPVPAGRRRRTPLLAAAIFGLALVAAAGVALASGLGSLVGIAPTSSAADATFLAITPENGAGLREASVHDSGGDAPGPISISDDVVYVGLGSSLVAFAADCMERAPCSGRWTAELDGRLQEPASVWEGTVYAGAGSSETGSPGSLFAFPASCAEVGGTCVPSWSGAGGDLSSGAPLFVEGGGVQHVAAISDDGLRIYDRRCETAAGVCEPAAAYLRPDRDMNAAAYGAFIYAGTRAQADGQGHVLAYVENCNASNCPVDWEFQAVGDVTAIQVEGDDLVVGVGGVEPRSRDVYALSERTCSPDACEPKWTADVDGDVLDVVISPRSVVVLATEGVTAYSRFCTTTCDPQAPLWTFRSASPLGGQLAVADDMLYAGSLDGTLVALSEQCDSDCAPIWTGTVGGAVAAVQVAADQRHLVAAGPNGLHVFGVIEGNPGSADEAPSVPVAAPTNSPTPNPSIFPNTAESALLAKLPTNVASTCVRGGGKADTATGGWNGQIVVSRSGNAPNIVNNYGPVQPGTPKASLICKPEGGPDQLYVQELRLPPGTGDVGGEAAFSVAALATRYTIEPGSCSGGAKASTTWSVGGSSVPSGTVVCIPKAGWDGGSWIYWSFAGGNTLGFATRKDADYDALYQWWQNLTLFIE